MKVLTEDRYVALGLIMIFLGLTLAHPLFRLAGVMATDLSGLDEAGRYIGALMAGRLSASIPITQNGNGKSGPQPGVNPHP